VQLRALWRPGRSYWLLKAGIGSSEMIDGFIVNVEAIAIKRAACAETGRIAARRVLAW
jgi:hypothetical protein